MAAEGVGAIGLALGRARVHLGARHRGSVLGPGQGGTVRVVALGQAQQGGTAVPRERWLDWSHQDQTGGRRRTS